MLLFFALIASTLVIGGGLGGYARNLLREAGDMPADQDLEKVVRLMPVAADIAVGAVAGLVVPVFLAISQFGSDNGIMQTLVGGNAESASTSADRVQSFLILLGLAVLAGASAPRFIMNLSERIIAQQTRKIEEMNEQLEQMKTQVLEVKDEVEALPVKAAEPDREVMLGAEENKVLRGFFTAEKSGLTYPTVVDIAEISKTPAAEVEKVIADLSNIGLVAKSRSSTPEAERWRLRSPGRSMVFDPPEEGGLL